MKKAPLCRVQIVRLEAPGEFVWVDASHHETVSTFLDVTPRQLQELVAELDDDGATFVDVFLQECSIESVCKNPSTTFRWKAKELFSGVPSDVPRELVVA